MSQGYNNKVGGVYKYINNSWSIIDPTVMYWVSDYGFSSTGGKCTRNIPPTRATVDPTTGVTTTIPVGRKKGKRVPYYSSLFLTEQDAIENYLEHVGDHIARVSLFIENSLSGILSKTASLSANIKTMQEFADLHATIQKYAQVL